MSSKTSYYTVGDRIHPSSEKALIDFTKSKEAMTFHTGYDFYQKYPWKPEPIESLSYYKKKRAQQIRDKYKRVALAYSGGTDSHTILRAFVENNIQLDEIIINRTTHNQYRIWEFENITLPTLEKYLNKWKYKVKVNQTPSSMMQNVNDLLGSYKDDKYNGFFRQVVRTNFNPIIDYFNHKHNDFDLAKFNSNDCIVWGFEKPSLQIHNKMWCWQIHDKLWGNSDAHNEHCTSECFYISDDFPELTIKLSWILAKFLDKKLTNEQKKDNMYIQKVQAYADGRFDGGLYMECVHAMEYSAIDPRLTDPNAKPEVQADRFNYFQKLKDEKFDRTLYNEAMSYIENVRSQIGEDLKHKNNNQLVGIWTKPTPFMPVTYKNN